jgi:hypothetical protein
MNTTVFFMSACETDVQSGHFLMGIIAESFEFDGARGLPLLTVP